MNVSIDNLVNGLRSDDPQEVRTAKMISGYELVLNVDTDNEELEPVRI